MADYPIHRPVVLGTRAMVATGHPLASIEASRVIERGGNAVDAAITAAGVLAVVKPHMCGIGGDAFALIHEARSGRIVALNGNGPAPRAANVEAFPDGIPARGPSAASVPGAIGAWAAALARFGTIDLAAALQPAIQYAEAGFPVTHLLAAALARGAEPLRQFPGSAEVFLPAGRPGRPGQRLFQPDLAASLKLIAAEGPAAFYAGKIAEAIERYCRTQGGLITRDDLVAYRPDWYEPLQVDYRGLQVFGQPPVSVGFTLLEALNLVEGFDLAAMGHLSAAAIHHLIEAKKLAFADRDRYLGDPAFVQLPLAGLLSKPYATDRRRALDPARASTYPAGDPWHQGRDTTYFCVVDPDGNAVSFIQSIFASFGSAAVVPGTGVLLNNRMTGFSTDRAHVNCVAPAKRPLHTLNTVIACRDGRPLLVFGSPGAHGQVQTNLQVLTGVVDFGLNVQAAVEAPRWRNDDGLTLTVETRLQPDVLADLTDRGHLLRPVGPWSDELGGAQAILIDAATGTLQGGADPRREGYAIGW